MKNKKIEENIKFYMMPLWTIDSLDLNIYWIQLYGRR